MKELNSHRSTNQISTGLYSSDTLLDSNQLGNNHFFKFLSTKSRKSLEFLR